MNVATVARPARGLVRAAATPFGWVARARGWRWLVLVGAELLAAVVCGATLWWATGRVGVPAVGEPFDLAAFQVDTVAPRDNAYGGFRQAFDAYKPPSGPFPNQGRSRTRGAAPLPNPDDPAVRAWLDDNRESLAAFLGATRRTDFRMPADADPADAAARFQRNYGLKDLASLVAEEGARRERRGDLDGAWECNLAVFRAARLLARHARFIGRFVAGEIRSLALLRLSEWSSHPAVTRAQLRRALDDLQALDDLPPDDAFTVKSEYVAAMQTLDHSVSLSGYSDPFAQGPKTGHWALARNAVNWALYPLRRHRDGEPERSRRVVRLLTAQWLDYFARPPADRPPPTVRVVERSPWGGTVFTDFFEPRPGAPPPARAAPAYELAHAYRTTYDAKFLIGWFWTQFRAARNRERGDHAAALRIAAEALYRLDHAGQSPPDDAALVGPYLKAPLDESQVSPGPSDEGVPEIKGED